MNRYVAVFCLTLRSLTLDLRSSFYRRGGFNRSVLHDRRGARQLLTVDTQTIGQDKVVFHIHRDHHIILSTFFTLSVESCFILDVIAVACQSILNENGS